jgi:hypothetical protein
MALSRTGTDRSRLTPTENYLTFLGLGSTLSYEQYENDDGEGSFQGFGDASIARPAITGIPAVDTQIYSVEDQLDTFKLAMTVTTISSAVAAIGVLLVLFGGRRSLVSNPRRRRRRRRA